MYFRIGKKTWGWGEGRQVSEATFSCSGSPHLLKNDKFTVVFTCAFSREIYLLCKLSEDFDAMTVSCHCQT